MYTYTHTFSLVLYTMLGCKISKACPSSRPSVAMVTGGGGTLKAITHYPHSDRRMTKRDQKEE